LGRLLAVGDDSLDGLASGIAASGTAVRKRAIAAAASGSPEMNTT